MCHIFHVTFLTLTLHLLLNGPLLTTATDCYHCYIGGSVFAAGVDYSHPRFTDGIKREKLEDCPVVQCGRCVALSSGNNQTYGCEEHWTAEGTIPRPNEVCQAGLSYGPYDVSKPRWMQFSTCDDDCLHPPTSCNSAQTDLIDCPLELNSYDVKDRIVKAAFCFLGNKTNIKTGETVSLHFPDSVDPQNLCSTPHIIATTFGKSSNYSLAAYNCSHPTQERPVAAPTTSAVVIFFVVVGVVAIPVACLIVCWFYPQYRGGTARGPRLHDSPNHSRNTARRNMLGNANVSYRKPPLTSTG